MDHLGDTSGLGGSPAEPHAGHDHSAHSAHAGMNIECDGSEIRPGGGTWQGHFYPGLLFIIWGAWWCYNGVCYWLWRSARQPYRSRAWYPLARRWLWALEPALKIVVPLVAVSFELLLDHDMQFQYLYCPKGTKYVGRFAMTNINNWSHAASYPGVVMAGVVDLLEMVVPLPPGTSQAVLGFGFSVMSFIMYTHEKHEPLDRAVHWLLAVAMGLSAALVWLDLALKRRAVLAGLGRGLALVLQGAWLVQIAAVEFEDLPQWSSEYGGGAMLAPVVFTAIATACLAGLLGLHCALALLKQRGWVSAAATLLPLEEADAQGYAKPGLEPYDSAHASDDNDALLEEAGAGAATGRGGMGMAPFQIMHTRAPAKGSAEYV